MIKKILKKIGFITRKEGLDLRQEIFLLKEQARKVETKPRPVVDINIADPSPGERVARKEYISRAAAFHKDILDEKLKSMMAEVRHELTMVDNTSKMDDILKGTNNALLLLQDWGENCVNEMISYQAEPLDDEELKLLEDKLKE